LFFLVREKLNFDEDDKNSSSSVERQDHGTLKGIRCENNRMLRVVYPASGGRIKRSLMHIVSWM
jgi:hypothetical protein